MLAKYSVQKPPVLWRFRGHGRCRLFLSVPMRRMDSWRQTLLEQLSLNNFVLLPAVVSKSLFVQASSARRFGIEAAIGRSLLT